jgi:hypothetical protein
MNLQPDGAKGVHSVLDPRRRLRFERPKFEQRRVAEVRPMKLGTPGPDFRTWESTNLNPHCYAAASRFN